MSDTKNKEEGGCGASASHEKSNEKIGKLDSMLAHAKEFLEASPEEHKK